MTWEQSDHSAQTERDQIIVLNLLLSAQAPPSIIILARLTVSTETKTRLRIYLVGAGFHLIDQKRHAGWVLNSRPLARNHQHT